MEDHFRWYFYPLVVIPLTTKMYSFMPDLPADMIRRGQELFAIAEDVYLIGYRAIDEIFNEMATRARPSTRLHVVGRGNPGEVADRVAKQHNMQPGGIHTEGFLGFLNAWK